MSRSPAQYQPQVLPVDQLDEVMIRSGLADLVPCSQRGRVPLLLQMVLLLAGLVGVLGLPAGGALSCLVLALTIEAVSYQRRQLCPLWAALARRSVWDRIRPSFYWTLAAGAALVALLLAEASVLSSLLRGGFLWLCFRAIEDTIKHPERYTSMEGFGGWLERLGQQVARPWGLWFDLVILGITVSFLLNVAAPGLWQSVGNTGWDRLLLLVGALYLLASLALSRSSKWMVRATVGDSMHNLDGVQATDLSEVLRSARAVVSTAGANPGYTEQVGEQLKWKKLDSLVPRVGAILERTLIQRLRWSAFLASGLAFLLAFLFLAVSAFLIVPREVMSSWTSGEEAGGRQTLLAFDDFEELYNLEFEDRILGLDLSGLAQEPLPKVVFFEAALLVSLLVLWAANRRAVLRSMANADSTTLRRSLLLGTAYLTLREERFQHLFGGFITRQLTTDRTFRTITLENEVLLVPSVARKVAVYRALSGFLKLYSPPGWRSSTYLVALFASHRFAQVWATTFVRSPSTPEATEPLDRRAFLASDELPGKFWIWSGEQLLDMTSLEEAQWYGRFVAR